MKTIHIPKITNRFTYPVEIIKSKSTRSQLYLSKQIIEDIEIPKGSTISHWPHKEDFNNRGDVCTVPVDKVNALLRYVYLEGLRNK